MTNEQWCQQLQEYLMPTYRPAPVAFVRGEGPYLFDADGNRYLDFVAGIAVCATGHCHPRVVEAIRDQAGKLLHTSNLYCIPPAAQLAKRLVELSFADRCFFCNSGAEANEAAIKLARKWALKTGRPGRTIITALGSFHGRTLATVTATGQEKYNKNFQPLPPGFKYVPYNDIDALSAAIDDEVCAVMLEPIQGEGGVVVPDDDYLPAVRQLCDDRGVLLILDEVQTGVGRTGRWFAYEHSGIEPDVMTLAKGLASGVPIGACLARGEAAEAFEPGDHASTFGGNYLACAAALATLEVIESEGLLDNAARVGDYIQARVAELAADEDNIIAGSRGKGLLIAVLLAEPRAKEVEVACRRRGLIVNALGEDKLRLAPPLVITEQHANEALEILAAAARER